MAFAVRDLQEILHKNNFEYHELLDTQASTKTLAEKGI
jgi:hypothetical protein